jgi:hypothetical protein
MLSKRSRLYPKAPDTISFEPGNPRPVIHRDVPWFTVIVLPIIGVLFLALCAWVSYDCNKRRRKAKEEAVQAIVEHTGPAGTELQRRNPRPLYA